jgi:hypothetical protein
VLIAQVLVSFVIWILFGWFQARQGVKWRSILAQMSRRKRTVLGPILLVVGAAGLLGGIKGMAAVNGLADGSLTPSGWAIVTVVGIVFVGAQVAAGLMMVSLATQSEPDGTPQTSDRRINKGSVKR